MFKKALKIAVSFCLLVGGYAGYTRVFVLVTDFLSARHGSGVPPFPERETTSKRRALELAQESFPKGFWAASDELKLQYYEEVHGFYMYAQNKKLLNNNKTIHVSPFAMIWVSKDGRTRKIATSDEAIIDLTQPFMSIKPSNEPSKVTHAKLIGDVRLRDDKGTRDDPTDDLRVGPIDGAVEFDDRTLQITTDLDTDIFLQDRNLTMTGIGMMIQLRRKPTSSQAGVGGAAGFDAETAFVYKDVHIIVNNVTSDGVLPGKAKPEKSGKTPIDVRSAREMRIDLPRPHPQVVVGPPYYNRPPDPTFVKFKTNVRVIRGTDKTEQLDCDTLDLTLMPDPKEPEDEAGVAVVASKSSPKGDGSKPADGKPADGESEGPLTELKIRVALARGHDVWLQSEAQGMMARCVELKYEKHAFEGLPDITYLNGGTRKTLMVEKVDYDTKAAVPGTIKSIMRLTALDATIFEFGGSGGASKVVARGPGKTEERPARNASVSRTVWFEDEMRMLTWREGIDPAPTPDPHALRSLSQPRLARFPGQPRPVLTQGTLRRLLTLTGVSKLVNHETSTTLDARASIVAEFQSEPNPPPLTGEGSAQIKWLDAFEDAHLTAPSKTLTARNYLKASFEPAPAPPKPVAPPTPVTGAVPGPAVAAATPAPTPPPAEPEPKRLPAEPLVDGRADRVWAWVELGATGQGSAKSNGELKEARLRGGVMVHQDPKPGKAAGSDASGEALDLTTLGNGLMKLVVKREEPQAYDPKTRLASSSNGRAASTLPMARVETEGKVIESDDIIGLDQKLDFMWVQGAGVFSQMTDRGLLDDKGIDAEKPKADPKAKPTGPTPQDRMIISWNREMRFYGKSTDLEGRPAAKIEFRGDSMDVRSPDGRRGYRRGVETRMTDSAIYADTMDVYLDRVLAFNKGAPKGEDPQIAMLECKGQDIVKDGVLKWAGVDITSQKVYPENGELKEKQRIQGQHVIYDKRTGNFYAPGSGTTYLYRRKGGDSKTEAPIPTAFPISSAPSNGRSRPEVVLTDKKLPLLELTKIKFTDGMRGRFGVAKDKGEEDNQTREAQFFGAVEAAHASVLSKSSDIDFDNVERWPDSVFLTSDVLNVVSIPNAPGSKPADRQLLHARGNALAKSNTDVIQADRITYNSATSLTYAYGEDGKEVSVTKQDSRGQRPITARGKSARYNNVTRESKMEDPYAMSFTDYKTGIRPKPFFPDLGGSPKPGDPIKQPRQPLQRQGRQATERYGFTGH